MCMFNYLHVMLVFYANFARCFVVLLAVNASCFRYVSCISTCCFNVPSEATMFTDGSIPAMLAQVTEGPAIAAPHGPRQIVVYLEAQEVHDGYRCWAVGCKG